MSFQSMKRKMQVNRSGQNFGPNSKKSIKKSIFKKKQVKLFPDFEEKQSWNKSRQEGIDAGIVRRGVEIASWPGRPLGTSERGFKIICVLLINHRTLGIFASFAISFYNHKTPLTVPNKSQTKIYLIILWYTFGYWMINNYNLCLKIKKKSSWTIAV